MISPTSLTIRPIPQTPALFIKEKDMLVITDLHIGIENELQDQGLHVSSQLPHMWYILKRLIDDYQPKNIVILGDIKHSIPQTPFHEKKQLRSFFQQLNELATIHIIPGNHDGNIQWYLPDDVLLHESDGVLFDTLGCVHGHRWPKEAVMNASYLLMGHTHPTLLLQDRLKYETYESCWVKTGLNIEQAKEKYDSFNEELQIIVLPAFNPLCGGMAVNKEGVMGPMNALIDKKKSEYFLLDGSYLGTSKNFENDL
ncbi:MAG: metallophosphoesterase [Candidatus Thermoplasmatota archaeon]|nr:metallophosphoesterase [Candidatus Thermoplasmatota archaeon]